MEFALRPKPELSELLTRLDDCVTTEQAAHAVVDWTGRRFPGSTPSIMLRHRHHLFPVLAGSEDLRAADVRQIVLGEGPAVDASTRTEFVLVDDLRTAPGWPQWVRFAVELGLRSILSGRLISRDRNVLGVLTLADRRPQAFTPEEAGTAMLLTQHIAVGLDRARIRENQHLALQAQTVIGQACGILMERLGLNGEQSLALLRGYSRDHHRKLRQIAADLVATGRLPGEPGIGSVR